MEILGYKVKCIFNLFLTFFRLSNCYPKWLYHFTHPPEVYEFQLLTLLPTVAIINFSYSDMYTSIILSAVATLVAQW